MKGFLVDFILSDKELFIITRFCLAAMKINKQIIKSTAWVNVLRIPL